MKGLNFASLVSLSLILAGATGNSVGADAPNSAASWRGDGTGLYPAATPVTEWQEGKNIIWSTKVGESYSSPIVAGNKVFITAEPNLLICLDRVTGKILWQKSNSSADLAVKPTEEKPAPPTSCGYTVPTAVSDGKQIYVVIATGIVACYDLEGNRKWIKSFDREQFSSDGRSASPILAGNKLIIHLAYLTALDTENGNVAWEAKESMESFGTPVTARIGNVEVIITPKGDIVRAADGVILAKEIQSVTYGSPVVQGNIVYFIGHFATAVQLPASAEKGEKDKELKTKELWNVELEGEFYASPVIQNGLVYIMNNDAIYYVLSADKGEILLKNRVEDLPPNIYASVSLAGKNLVIGNNQGTTMVFAPGKEYKVISTNKLGSGAAGTPIFVGGQTFLRSGDLLYCIGAK